MDYKLLLIVIIYLLFEGGNTLLTEYCNVLSSEGRDQKDHLFIHPFLQLWGFAVGEFASIFLCLIWYLIKKTKDDSVNEMPEKKKINPLLLLPPAIFEMLMLSAFFIALVFTNASSYQIISGANLIFGCIFSRIFLKRKLEIYQWIAIFITIGGVIVVGLGDLLDESNAGDNPLIGDIFSVLGTIFYAAQLCYEEKILKSYDIKPIVILSYEGAFNLVISTLLLVGFYFLKVPFDMQQPNGVMEDSLDGFVQLGNNPVLLIAFIGACGTYTVRCLAKFGITKELSAVHMIVIYMSVPILVWAVSLGVGWQTFEPLQIVGFLLIVVGNLIFNDVLLGPTGIKHLIKKNATK